MTAYLIDSSALVKRYVPEMGSLWLRQLANPLLGHELIIARITLVEVLSALARRQREGSLTATDRNVIIRRFRFDLSNQYQVIELDQALAEAAGRLVIQYPLRAYDAVQLASGLRIQSALAAATSTPLVFITADNRLLAIAQTEGLLTDNPNHYP